MMTELSVMKFVSIWRTFVMPDSICTLNMTYDSMVLFATANIHVQGDYVLLNRSTISY